MKRFERFETLPPVSMQGDAIVTDQVDRTAMLQLARDIVNAASTDSEWPPELFRDDLMKFDPRQFPFAPLDGQKVVDLAQLVVKQAEENFKLRSDLALAEGRIEGMKAALPYRDAEIARRAKGSP